MRLKYILLITIVCILSGCVLKDEKAVATFNSSANLVKSGDIVVVNITNDSIVLLDQDGNYKLTLFNDDNSATVIIGGINYDSVSKRLLFNYDSSTAILDEVRSISLYSGRISTVLNNVNVTGALQGVARLTGGDYVILESTTVAEKFNSSFVRQGAPFPLTVLTNVQIESLSTGGFLACTSGTANTVRTYSAAGAIVNTATSASPTPTLGAMGASGCVARPDGTIVVAYSGTTDAVRAYSANLGTVLWDYSNTTVLSTPGKMAVRANGNILVTDTAMNHIVEISSTGAFVRIIAGSSISTPGYIEVIP